MTDLVITAANVKQSGNAVVKPGIAGATITAGQAITLNAATGKMVLSDNDGAGLKNVDGIALHGALADQPIAYQTGGDITLGATMTAGTAYYLSATPGGICPVADLGSGKDPIIIGVARTTTVLALRIVDVDVTL